MDVRRFAVPGEPKGKGRPKFSRAMGRAYTPLTTATYENLVKVQYQQTCEDRADSKDPVLMEIKAYYGIPISTSKKKAQEMRDGYVVPVKKPDADNVAKIVCDALNELAYKDDTAITDLIVRRRYSDKPRVEIYIRPYERASDFEEE